MDQAVTSHIPEHSKAGLLAANANKALAKQNALQDVLERLQANESVRQIADSLNISDVALYMFLLRNAPEQWKAISASKALAKLDKSDSDLDSCADGVSLGRARERIRLAQWTAERTCRSIYGDDKALININMYNNVSIEAALTEAQGRLIDAPQQD